MSLTTKKKVTTKKEASDIKEKCKECGSKDFAIAKNNEQTRYCSKCSFVWMPMTPDQLLIQQLKENTDEMRLLGKQMINLLDDLIPDILDQSVLATLKEIRNRAMGLK